MKKYIMILIGGALFLCLNPICAKVYYLSCNMNYQGKLNHQGSRMPKYPLHIDYDNHIITIPNTLLGYTFTLRANGVVILSNILVNNEIRISSNIQGEAEVEFTNGNETYYGVLAL